MLLQNREKGWTGMVKGNFFEVYLVIKLWYFLIVLSGFFESGRLQQFFDPKEKTVCLALDVGDR